VHEDQRKEIETMISAAVEKRHGENLQRFAEIRERIIGIDGNGTGRIGALQRQDAQLASIKSTVKDIGAKVDALTTAMTTWNKRDVLKLAGWVFGTLIAMSAVAVAYMDYHAKYHAGEPLLSEHPTTASYTTSDSR
jgi:hypothetical protein